MEVMTDKDAVSRSETRTVSSTVARRAKTRTASSIVKVDPRVAEIERDRETKGIGQQQLCLLAGISICTWWALRRGFNLPIERTLRRLRAALDTGERQERKPPKLILGFHRMVMVELCRQLRAPVGNVMTQDLTVQRPRNKKWLRAARINRMAIYITSVELELENAELGRAIGCTRQNVKQARDDVEDWRDRPSIDRVMRKVTSLVTERRGA